MPDTVTGTSGYSLVSIPDKVTGYQLDPGKSFWYAITPEETENLLINPSFENVSVGLPLNYSTSGSWVADGAKSSRGVIGMRGGTTAGSSVTQTVSLGTGPHTFSIDLYGFVGRTYELRAIRSAQIVGVYAIRPTYNGWQRYSLSFAANTSGSYTVGLFVTNAGNEQCYTDAWQLEAKAYPTTYADGDMPSLNQRGRREYYWTGTPHASTSVRIAQTYDGGRIVSFEDTGFMTTGIVGLGMPNPNIVETTLGVSGTRQYAGQTTMPREFAITGVFTGCDFPTLMSQRNSLMNLLNPYATTFNAPLSLVFQLTDQQGNTVGPPLRLRAAYIEGLGGNLDSFTLEEVTLRFRMYDPFIESMFDAGGYLGTPATLQQNTGVAYRYPDGTWTTLADELTNNGETTVSGSVNAVKFDDATGYLYVVGNFQRDTDDGDIIWPVTGKHVANNLFRWKPGGEIEGLFNSGWGGPIHDIAFGRDVLDGWYILVGEFLNPTGSATNADRIYAWQPGGNVGGPLAGGFEPAGGLNGPAYCVEALSNGSLLVGGKFTDGQNVTGLNLGGIVLYIPDPAAFVAPGTSPDGSFSSLNNGFNIDGVADRQVNCLAVSPTGVMYAGGTFTRDKADTKDLKYVARWNGSAWEAVGQGLGGEVMDLTFGPDGALYAVGLFQYDGSGNVLLNYHARFNGQNWEALGNQAFYNYGLDFIYNGRHFSGGGYVLGAIWPTIASEIARISGNVIVPADIATYQNDGPLTGTYNAPHTIDSTPAGAIALGFTKYEDTYTIITNAVVEWEYDGTAPVRPKIVIIGPGNPRIVENITTGSAIYFNYDFELGIGERLTIDLTGPDLAVYTDKRQNVSAYMLPSDFGRFELVPGVNRLSFFMDNYIAPTGFSNGAAYLYYTPRYLGIDHVGRYA